MILVEEPEPEGPFGAKGVGEIGLVPTAAAVAGALEAFDGIRRVHPADEGLARRPRHERRPDSEAEAGGQGPEAGNRKPAEGRPTYDNTWRRASARPEPEPEPAA